MGFDLLGWPEGGPRLCLDYRRLVYTGKFVTAATDKTMLHDPDNPLPLFDDDRPALTDSPDSLPPLAEDVIVAVAFNENRTSPTTLWLRYVTVWWDRRGDGPGPGLLRRTCDAVSHGYKTVRIVANDPFAYEAYHRTRFGLTGHETGVIELMLEHPADAPTAVSHGAYQSDPGCYRVCDSGGSERAFLAARERIEPPEIDTGHSND